MVKDIEIGVISAKRVLRNHQFLQIGKARHATDLKFHTKCERVSGEIKREGGEKVRGRVCVCM